MSPDISFPQDDRRVKSAMSYVRAVCKPAREEDMNAGDCCGVFSVCRRRPLRAPPVQRLFLILPTLLLHTLDDILPCAARTPMMFYAFMPARLPCCRPLISPLSHYVAGGGKMPRCLLATAPGELTMRHDSIHAQRRLFPRGM